MPVTTFEDNSDCYQNARNVVKSIYYFFKEALATILTKKIVCFGNWYKALK